MRTVISKRGPRDTKLTVLVPHSLLDDLRKLRETTGQSTGDLVNCLLENELSKQAAAIERGQAFLEAKEDTAKLYPKVTTTATAPDNAEKRRKRIIYATTGNFVEIVQEGRE